MTAALAALSCWTVGTEGLIDYGQLLAHYLATRHDAPQTHTVDHAKYVDFMVFVHRILPHPATALRCVLAGVGLAAGGVMARLAWQAGQEGAKAESEGKLAASAPGMQLAWAATLACTPILSPHCAIYDTLFVIPAVMLTANFLATRRGRSPDSDPADPTVWLTMPLAALVVLLYLTAWITQPLARLCQVQMLTLVLAALGIYIARLARQHFRAVRVAA